MTSYIGINIGTIHNIRIFYRLLALITSYLNRPNLQFFKNTFLIMKFRILLVVGFFCFYKLIYEAIVAQGRRTTVNVTVVGSIPTRGPEIFNIFNSAS